MRMGVWVGIGGRIVARVTVRVVTPDVNPIHLEHIAK